MKLALYLPNFREKVTVQELRDLAMTAEELDFDSVWTLDREAGWIRRITDPGAPTAVAACARPGSVVRRTA